MLRPHGRFRLEANIPSREAVLQCVALPAQSRVLPYPAGEGSFRVYQFDMETYLTVPSIQSCRICLRIEEYLNQAKHWTRTYAGPSIAIGEH